MADGRELLARGRLSEELSGTGWEIVAGFAPSPRARSKQAGKPAEKADDTAERRAAEIQTHARRVRELRKKSLAEAREAPPYRLT